LAVSYLIEVGNAPGLANLANFFSSTTFFAGAAPNGTYFVRVRAVEADGTRSAATTNETTVVVTPSANPELVFNAPQPVNGRVGEPYFFSFCNSPNNNGANCAGAPGVLSGGVAPYHFQLDTAGGFPPIGLILAPNGALTGTPSGRVTNHSFKVCAVDTTGVNRCPIVTMTIEARDCIPSAPTGLSATVNGSTVTVNWNRAAGATSYLLEAGMSSGGTDAFYGDIGSANSLTAPGVPAGRYYIRVRGNSGCGLGAASAEVTAVVGGTSSSTYIGSHSGGGSYFKSSNGCTWNPTYAGTVTVAVRQGGTGGATGTIRITGTERVPTGSTSTPNFTCSPSTFSYDVTAPLTFAGTTISRSGIAIQASTGSFTGTLSGNTITGTLRLQYTNGTGSISMPVTLTLSNDLRETSGLSQLMPSGGTMGTTGTPSAGPSAFMWQP
jgi:hypothetical protein